MPMPATITDADLARWDRALHLCSLPQIQQACTLSDGLTRMWYPGMYLAEQLQALGCTAETHQRIALDLSHRLVQSLDPWEPTLQILEEYRQGQFDRPANRATQTLLHHAQMRGLLPFRSPRKVSNGKHKGKRSR